MNDLEVQINLLIQSHIAENDWRVNLIHVIYPNLLRNLEYIDINIYTRESFLACIIDT